MKAVVLFILLIFLMISHTYADESNINTTSDISANIIAIPYKEDKNLSQQSTPVMVVLFLFILLVIVFLYFFKNKLSLVNNTNDKNINVLEVKRLNARLTVFHLEVKGKEVLIMQSGDSVKTLDLNDKSDNLVDS